MLLVQTLLIWMPGASLSCSLISWPALREEAANEMLESRDGGGGGHPWPLVSTTDQVEDSGAQLHFCCCGRHKRCPQQRQAVEDGQYKKSPYRS